MDFKTRYANLNAAQKQAVDTIDGPVMVIAGPGTGKTELLSMRTANILQKTDTLPENILCLTFTESGANAMRERLVSIIGPAAYRVAIHTFHSFGTEIINQNGEFFYHGAHFRPADELSSYEILRTLFDGLHHKNPLASQMNGEYTHLADTLTVISELKKSGLTGDELRAVLDANDAVINAIEPVFTQLFSNRLSKGVITHLEPVVQTLRAVEPTQPLATITPLSVILADSLEYAVTRAQETESTKPITAWRTQWFKKNEKGDFILKSRERGTKLRAVADLYDRYLVAMHEAELYDFDDMILRVVHAMEVFPELRFNLQERFQYIMVDEFQDTNMAQMRILFSLTDNEVNNGRPNILVVGDDDQAIYSFQGADIGNIHTYRTAFEEVRLIALTDNYRSAPAILDHARAVITQGSDRLETHIPELDKTLAPHRPNEPGAVTLTELPSRHDEYAWVAESIKQAIETGQSPSSIAVLARRHHELVSLLPYFAEKEIAVNYERRDNVLDLAPIKIVEHVAHIVIALFEQRHDDANGLLPELLAHPAFQIPAMTLWRVSLQSQANAKGWMEIIAVTPELQPIHAWLVGMAKKAAQSPLEYLIDEIIGTPDSPALAENNNPLQPAFRSPLYDYYFAPAKLQETPDQYLQYLDALLTIRQRLQEYAPDETPTLQSALEFIRLHRHLDRQITSTRAHGEHLDRAVNLMTAHKSKGLEFDTVYTVGAIDSSWGERVRSRSRLINYPENLPLAPSGDTFDERLRLFFVAMTRAKKQLRISYSTSDFTGKGTQRASFLLGDTWQANTVEPSTTVANLTKAAGLQWYQPVIEPLTQPMRDLLVPKLDAYKLSSTHLTHFLDVSRGGPQLFLVHDFLKFPRAKHPNAAYGSAIHITLQRTHAHLAATGKHRPIEDILHDFEQNLRAQRLPQADFDTFLQKGSDTLSAFLEEKYITFTRTQKTELNFASQGVHLGRARLTGSLDLVDIRDDSIIVTDYKTGKPTHTWTGRTDYEKIKLHHYKQQLMFYNLLILNARDYRKYTFEKGVLQFVEPTAAGDIVAIEATFTANELRQFAQLIERVWERIMTLDFPDITDFEPNYSGILAFEQSLLDD
ncbi:ATP-dependent DNA helicase [Streptomyces caniscabiei]|uniref:ATP-dependent DNA helicase n=1 Tax=Streptomyces caniscabiei TaxID=2746961 RepID=UPI0029ABF2B5|nr:ATP-dependent DNA helicase [Streptomyces caniscabiei]MDX2776078.1 ATP-dependent DNA helicase [Streptomyces caniscabiei]